MQSFPPPAPVAALPPPAPLPIPAYSGTPENRAEILALHQRLQSLQCQALALAVREWFEVNPDWTDPFVITFSASKTNRLRSVFPDLAYDDLGEEKKSRLDELSSALDAFLSPAISEFVHDLSDTLQLIKWNPRYVDRVLATLLRDYAGFDGRAFLAQVDATKSGRAPAQVGQPLETLPSYLALSDELDLRAASERVATLLVQRQADDLLTWIEERTDARGYFPEVVAEGKGLSCVQSDPNDRVPASRASDVQALIDIFHRDGLEAFSRAPEFAESFCTSCAQTDDATPLLNVLRYTLRTGPVPIDPGFVDGLHATRALAALEAAIVPARQGPKGRL